MIAVVTNEIVVLDHWLPVLRQLPRGTRPHPDLIGMISQGSLAEPPRERTRRAYRGLREVGVPVIPLCWTVGEVYKHDINSWFDRRLWMLFAERLARLAELRDADPRMAIDLEPCWDAGQRYPVRGEPGVREGVEEYRLAEALEPFIATIKHEGILPWILPGGLEYAPSWHVAAACSDAVLLDEVTYQAPFAASIWKLYELRKAAIEALRRSYLPGFFGAALRMPEFLKELQRRGIGDFWAFFRVKDEEHRFWLPEWQQGGDGT